MCKHTFYNVDIPNALCMYEQTRFCKQTSHASTSIKSTQKRQVFFFFFPIRNGSLLAKKGQHKDLARLDSTQSGYELLQFALRNQTWKTYLLSRHSSIVNWRQKKEKGGQSFVRVTITPARLCLAYLGFVIANKYSFIYCSVQLAGYLF